MTLADAMLAPAQEPEAQEQKTDGIHASHVLTGGFWRPRHEPAIDPEPLRVGTTPEDASTIKTLRWLRERLSVLTHQALSPRVESEALRNQTIGRREEIRSLIRRFGFDPDTISDTPSQSSDDRQSLTT